MLVHRLGFLLVVVDLRPHVRVLSRSRTWVMNSAMGGGSGVGQNHASHEDVGQDTGRRGQETEDKEY